MYVSKRTRKKPSGIFFEFVEPSNNLTVMKYVPPTNPFAAFNFTEEIPNPCTRHVATTNADYTKRYSNRKK